MVDTVSQDPEMFTETTPDLEPEVFINEPPAQPGQSEQQTKLTAQLAAIPAADEDGNFFDSLVEKNMELIDLGEEVLLREEAKQRNQLARSNALQDIQTAALLQGQTEEAAEYINFEFETATDVNPASGFSELEKQGVEGLQNKEMLADLDFGDAQRQRFAEDAGSTLDLLRDEAVKGLIFNRYYDQYITSLQENGELGLADVVQDSSAMILLPFYDLQGMLNINEIDTNALRPGKQIRKEIEDLFATPADQFEERVAELFQRAHDQSGIIGANPTVALMAMQQYREGTMSRGDVVATDAFAALDSTILAAPIAKVLGASRSLSGLSKVIGARKMAATIDTSELLKTVRRPDDAVPAVGEEAVEAVKDVLPQAMKPTTALDDADPTIGISAELANKLDEVEAVAKQLDDILVQGRLSEGQIDSLVSAKKTQLTNELKHLDIEDMKQVKDPVTNVTSIETYIGKKGGGGYATRPAAVGAAARRGLDNVEVVEDKGRFFLKRTDTVEELGPDGYPLVSRQDNELVDYPASGPVTAGIRNPDNIVPEELAERRHSAELAEVKFRENIIKPLAREINKLGSKNLKALNTVMGMGRADRKWYGIDEFALNWRKTTGKDPSEQDFVAYQAAKQLNDIDYAVHNNKVYTDLARRGARVVSVENPITGFKINDTVAYQIKNVPENLEGFRAYDVDNNIVRTGSQAPEEIEDLKEMLATGDYKIYRLKDGVQWEGEPVHKIITKASNVVENTLPRTVLNYVPGGHLIRRTKWFAKQANVGQYKDGTTYVLSPRAVATFRTEGQAVKWTEEVNEALDAYRELRTLDGLEEASAAARRTAIRARIENSPFDSLDNLEEMVKKGEIDPEHPIEPVFDRGLPSFYWQNRTRPGSFEDRLFEEAEGGALDGDLQWMDTTGQLYYGRRSLKGLKSPHEEKDVVFNPLASVSRGITHAARTHAFDTYFDRSIEEWVRVAAPFIDKDRLGNITDARGIFFNAELSQQLRINNPKAFDKLEENRVIIRRTMGMQTPTQERISAAKRNLARFVESKGGDLGTKAVMKVDDIQSNNPVNAINALVFDSWLGLFDLSQMFVQTQTAVAAVTLAPKWGLEAATMFPAMRWASVNKSSNLLDYIAKNGQKIHGQSPDDFKMMVKEFQKSGWDNPGGEVAYLDQSPNGIGATGIMKAIQDGRKTGRIFFNEAERWNRMIAWQIAWKETAEAAPNLKPGSVEHIARVNQRTSDYSQNMTAISNSKIQDGIFSLPTRFMGYQMRLLENMLPKMFGGSSKFTGRQKARLAAGQIMLYGAAGTPFGAALAPLIREQIRNVTGQDPNLATVKAIESGLIDSAAYFVSGGDLNTDFARRAGSFRGWDDTLSKLSNGEMSSFAAVLLGPTGSYGQGYMESIGRVATYLKGTRSPADLDLEDANFVFNELVTRHVSSMNRASKAMWIWRTGQVVDPVSGRPRYSATDLEGAAAFLGIPLWEDSERNRIYKQLQNRDDEVREVSKVLAGIDRAAYRAMGEGDFEKADRLMTQGAVLLDAYKDDDLLMQQIAKAATKELGYTETEWQRLVEQVERRLGQEVPQRPDNITFEE